MLGDQLVEVLVHGSYVLGDFRPNRGDLDYIVVTNGDLTEATNARLFDLHDGYRSTRALLLHQLEGTFYPKGFLATLASPFVGCYIGTTRRGWRTITTLQNSYIDLRLAGQCGRRLLAEYRSGANRFDAPGEALFACLAADAVVAVGGLNREPDNALARAGRVRRLYVLPELRGQGLGRALIGAISSVAAQHFDMLTVNVGKPARGTAASWKLPVL